MGIGMIMGAHRTRRFFLNKRKIPGSVAFFVGVLLVLYGWPVIGMLIEGFGIVNLFKNFFPKILSWAQYLPVIGPIIQSKPIQTLIKKLQGGPLLPLYENKTMI